jgi:hypothetical protein
MPFFSLLAFIAAIAIWFLSFSLDRTRIAEYIQQRGGRIVSINWAPFGRGWFGEKNDRIYEVVYYDKEGNQHFASAKTSLWSGVYWTEDRITYRKPTWYDSLPAHNEPGHPLISQIPQPQESEVDELLRLREENAQLRALLARVAPTPPHVLLASVQDDTATCPACDADISPEDLTCPQCHAALREGQPDQ